MLDYECFRPEQPHENPDRKWKRIITEGINQRNRLEMLFCQLDVVGQRLHFEK